MPGSSAIMELELQSLGMLGLKVMVTVYTDAGA